MDSTKSPRWVPRAVVCSRYKTTDRTIDRWIIAGKFPPPQVIGVNTFRWDLNILDEYDADPDGWKEQHASGEITDQLKLSV